MSNQTPISPKVIAPAVFNLALIAVTAFIAALTPDLFAFLGVWSVPVYAAVAAVGTYLTGYLKSDPLR